MGLIHNVEKVLVKPRWSALRQLSFVVSRMLSWEDSGAELAEVLNNFYYLSMMNI